MILVYNTVIAIIVLLILAGVTIAALSGPNGILTNATKAKEETEKAEIEEQGNLIYVLNCSFLAMV